MASLTNVLAGIPGYAGYIAAQQAGQEREMGALRQVSTLAQIQAQLEAKQKEASAQQREVALRDAIAALPPEKRTREHVLPLLLEHGNITAAANLLPAAPKPEGPQQIGSGGLRMPDGTIIPPAAKPGTEGRAPHVRQRYDGTNVIQEEMQPDGTWKQIGVGPRFAPERAPASQPKPPTGFRYKPDDPQSLEPIPGGPKDTAPRDLARAKGAMQKADIVIRKVDEAMAQTGFFSTGLTGSVLGMVPGTSAYDLDKTIDTIKANLGFSELQAMREASPTGGALGQVAIQELAMLQSTVASLEHGQSEEQLRRGLQQVKKHYENWKRAVAEANPAVIEGAPQTPTAPTPQAPTGGAGGAWSPEKERRYQELLKRRGGGGT